MVTFSRLYPHCGFRFTKSYVRDLVMCGPHTSLCSSAASPPTYGPADSEGRS